MKLKPSDVNRPEDYTPCPKVPNLGAAYGTTTSERLQATIASFAIGIEGVTSSHQKRSSTKIAP